MCRHLAYLGPEVSLAELLTAPAHGLFRQSWEPRRQQYGTVNADGYGIGWYPPGPDRTPARYRRSVPIWADPDLPDLARTLRSGAVLAAVRDATPGTALDASANAPFRTGRWLFSHNGAVQDWRRLPEDTGTLLPSAALLGLEAASDSALLWVLVHERLAAGEPPDAALAAVVRMAAAVRPQARLNLLLTDGQAIAATRWGDSLWYRAGAGRVVVASEPDDDSPVETDDADAWHEVPQRCALLATPASVRTIPLSPVAHRPVEERTAFR
ncbi:ergothioneine biosynthesis protein EgtC [Streptacidiphilus sp. PB12-B1b]|uniref:ergothioneine biosynthesis protein EgtC n=1 Tax=Streptacidiphilus sp. PB12-B1b TaxID=2705012 RepID=UPI0015FD01D9|nr:ergothioneine biosynthesis protein EgtC [Streptacidiphilus sp. PB12-B1b]QMU77451.1 ergothioneine biosynthesis protein EgtC [Streptacidiphilus sp. PB12-B1b]